MNLSKRLQQIDHMITRQYDHIWDCCCDHGLLGKKLLTRNAAETINFVDVVDSLMTNLSLELQQNFAETNAWQVHCLSAADIPLTQGRNLIIISGVGGDLLIDLVYAIIQKHPNQKLEFLLCPVYHNYKVRQSLTKMGFSLLNESLVKERKHFYEIIHVATFTTETSKAISNVGSIMWDFSLNSHREYLAQTLAHYQRASKNTALNTSKVVSEYQTLSL